MADEPEEPEDEDAETGRRATRRVEPSAAEAEVSALAELALCEIWPRRRDGRRAGASRWTGADAAVLWAPTPCSALPVPSASPRGRRRSPAPLGAARWRVHSSARPGPPGARPAGEESPPTIRSCAGCRRPSGPASRFPSRRKGSWSAARVVFTQCPTPTRPLDRTGSFSSRRRRRSAGPAPRAKDRRHAPCDRAANNLYDLSKAFGSTIDTASCRSDRAQGRRLRTRRSPRSGC